MSDRVIREPFPIVSVEKSSFKETYGGAEDIVMVFCTLIRTAEPSETCLVTMHPIGGTGSVSYTHLTLPTTPYV